MVEGICSNCNHDFHALCSVCHREFGCGSIAKKCGIDGCEDSVLTDNAEPLFFVMGKAKNNKIENPKFSEKVGDFSEKVGE